jgi:hypothetical protein
MMLEQVTQGISEQEILDGGELRKVKTPPWLHDPFFLVRALFG